MGLLRKKTKDFIVNRVLRIYPVYIVSVLALSIIALLSGRPYSCTKVLANLTLLQMLFGIGNINGASWVLPYDIVIYILCIIFKKYLKNTKVVLGGYYLLCAGILGVSFIRCRTQRRLPVGIMLLFAVALLGHILRMYREKIIQRNQIKVPICVFFLITPVSTILGYYSNGYDGFRWYNYFSSFALAAAFFIYSYIKNNYTHHRYILFVSKISYSLFLMHPVAFELFNIYRDGYTRSVFLVICIIVTFAAALISYYLIEVLCRTLFYEYQKKQRK